VLAPPSAADALGKHGPLLISRHLAGLNEPARTRVGVPATTQVPPMCRCVRLNAAAPAQDCHRSRWGKRCASIKAFLTARWSIRRK